MTAILAKPTRGKQRAHFADCETYGVVVTLCGQYRMAVAGRNGCTTIEDLYEFANDHDSLACKLCAAMARREGMK